jgi:hypothetical protein
MRTQPDAAFFVPRERRARYVGLSTLHESGGRPRRYIQIILKDAGGR